MSQLSLEFRRPARADTQAERILEHLKSGARLTSLEALERFACFRLAARVGELRAAGYPIETERVETASGATVAAYRLPPHN